MFTENDGVNWTTVQLPPFTISQGLGVAPNGDIYSHKSPGQFWFSQDLGTTWEIKIAPFQSYDVGWFFYKNEVVYARIGLSSFTYYFSKNGGNSWTKLPFPPGLGGYVYSHISKWGELFLYQENKLWKTNDDGQTWIEITFPKLEVIREMVSTDDGRMYLTGESTGFLYYSDDFGQTWAVLEDETLGVLPLISEGRLYLTTFGSTIFRTSNFDFVVAKISGQIIKDQNQNCLSDTSDLPLQNWLIQATDTANHTSYATTDQNGHYRLGFIIPDSTSTDLTLKTLPPNQLWQPCDSTQTVTVTPQDDTKTGIDFPVDAVVDCPLLDVSASFWPARPCFPLTVGADWCNLGTLPAPDSRLFLKLDPLISVDSASMPIAAQHGDTLEFALGDVGLNACGSVRVYGHLSCDAVLGQAICVSAKVTPDSICAAFPAWSGATLHATANCVGDSVVDFTIKNIGDAPSTSGLEYVVIEDQVLLFQGSLPSLVPGQEIPFLQPADGSTYWLNGEQEPGHPLSDFYAAWQEGCGAAQNGQPEFGWITPFLGEDGDPFSDEFCRETTASYDPNLKEALPVGYGAEHFISPNQAIDYFLHFQNTGTDTAFQVVLRDTISSLLDLASLRMGASSHAFSYEIYGNGILKFIFKKINLPDSTVNEPASHGWVSFQIGQKKDLPLGTVIRNHVGIYFDFNAPVLTNETWHTLGENFILLDWKNPAENPKTGLKIYPNPMTESVVFDLQNIENQEVAIEISTPDGRVVRRADFSQKPFFMKRDGLPSGVYFFKISTKNGGIVGEGKLLVR